MAGDASLARYHAWVAEQGVYCHEAVATTCEGVVAGYGCIATRKIKRGEVLFRVPRQACFGPKAGAAIDAEPPGDTQEHFARRLLKERAKGTASRWAPLLGVLTPAPCPWIWPAAAHQFLDGTELQEVLERKRKRLRRERKGTGSDDGDDRSREYDCACALVASHLNPWFGGSITPVNCTLNYAASPNVEFEAEGADSVVARALRVIPAGEELTQEYSESTAMFLYRYGFLPSAIATAAASSASVASAASAASTATAGPAFAAVTPLEEDGVSVLAADLAADLAATAGSAAAEQRLDWLCASGALGESPWDGLEDLVTAELSADGAGTAKLVGACLALGANAACWERAATAAAVAQAAAGGTDEDGNHDDVIAAALVASLFGLGTADAAGLAEVAAKEGGEEGDPWPSLLLAASAKATKGALDNAIQAALGVAREAVRRRLVRLEEAQPAAPAESKPAKRARSVTDAADSGGSVVGAWRMAQGLRLVERSILEAAARRLVTARPEGLGALA